MIKMVIFDLDDTLVDTSSFKELRELGQWTLLPQYLNTFQVLNHAKEAIDTLQDLNIHVAILTTSRTDYAKTILDHFSISPDTLYGYAELKSYENEYTSLKTGAICNLKYSYEYKSSELFFVGDSEKDYKACAESNVLFITHKSSHAWDVFRDSIFAVDSYMELINILSMSFNPCIFTNNHENFGEHIFFGKYFTDTYKTIDDGGHKYSFDAMHKRIVEIKNNKPKPLSNWLLFLDNIDLSPYFEGIDYVVRVLGSDELSIDINTITVNDILAYAIAKKLKAEYRYDILRKIDRNDKLHESGQGFDGRSSIISNKYIASNMQGKRVLVYDDLITTGATSVEVKRAISTEHVNNNTYFCSLGFTAPYTQEDYCQNIANTEFFACGTKINYNRVSLSLFYYLVKVLKKTDFIVNNGRSAYGIIDVRGMMILDKTDISFIFFNYNPKTSYFFRKDFATISDISTYGRFPNFVQPHIDLVLARLVA